jgi:tetratricopeptide (TPR) repeat protein
MKLKVSIKNIVFGAIGIISGLIITEGIFYLIPGWKEKYSYEQFIQYHEIIPINQTIHFNTFRSSGILGYERIPKSRPSTNSYGLNGREFDINKDNNIFRILLLGDSIIEGGGERDFANMFEQELNHLGINKKYEVINAAVGGYSVWQYRGFLKYKALKFNPDLILVSLSPDDFDINKKIYYKTKQGFVTFGLKNSGIFDLISVSPFLFRHVFLYRIFLVSLGKFLENKEIIDSSGEGRYYLANIQEICKDRQLPLVCIVWPYLLSQQEYTAWMRKGYASTKSALGSLNIEHIDLHKYFLDGEREKLRISENDYCHSGEAGTKIAVKAVLEYLLGNKYIDGHGVSVDIWRIPIKNLIEEAYLIANAGAYRMTGRLNEAEQAIGKALAIDRNDSLALLEKAKIYMEKVLRFPVESKKYLYLARETIDRALEINRESSSINAEAAFIYLQLGNIDKAKDLIEKALNAWPANDLGAYVIAYKVYTGAGDIEKAESVMKKGLDTLPFDPYSAAEGSLIYSILGNKAKAKELLDLLSNINWTKRKERLPQLLIYINSYYIHMKAGEKDMADAAMNKAVGLYSKLSEVNAQAACIYRSSGNRKKAKELIERSLSSEPDNNGYRLIKVWIEEGKEYD